MASAAHHVVTSRNEILVTELSPYQESLPRRAYDLLAQAVDHRIGWDKLPPALGLLVLVGLRDILRRKNLHDTNEAPDTPPRYSADVLTARTADGSYNDLGQPTMG